MKTYDQFREEYLQEMEYQAPPKPVPKAPIERKASQPETRVAPGIAQKAQQVKDTVKAGGGHADYPSDPKEQNKKRGKFVRKSLQAAGDALKRKKAGKAGTMMKNNAAGEHRNTRAVDSNKAPTIRSVFK